MLVLMNVRNKNKLFTKIVIKRLAMPTMGMTTNPKTTSSTTWTRHLIVKPMWMLKTKVIKIHQGVTSGTILAMTKGAEDNLNKIKMREPTLDNVNNLVKIRNNILNMSQVKLVFNSNANPMLWNMEDEENMYGKLKFNMPKFKGEDDAEAYLSWALKVDKIFRIHNYSGAKKVAMASLEFEDYANTWWEQVVTLREEKGDPPIDTWEDMKEEMEARFVPKHYKTDLFNKLQKLKQGTKTVEEFFKEMELTMMRANIQESENQTIARFFNGLNYPIKRIVEFQQYSNMVELVHQASKAERQVNEDIKYSKSKQYFASKLATSTPTTSVKPSASSTPSKQLIRAKPRDVPDLHGFEGIRGGGGEGISYTLKSTTMLKFAVAEVPVLRGGSSGAFWRNFGTWAELGRKFRVGGSSGPSGRKFRPDPFLWALEGILAASGRKFRSLGAEVPVGRKFRPSGAEVPAWSVQLLFLLLFHASVTSALRPRVSMASSLGDEVYDAV
ncbi:hypothetical protein QYE76_037471 [Lolium multiflorum]|uniref:Retrotransposon gag domain-containing protein n=1 Tax=Lolium multiflorum TaxID=4521 RepID=A0AAD8PW04_LOLMU|nr:hypothetical protein QYE76_037471 [Lolium multiflorum]